MRTLRPIVRACAITALLAASAVAQNARTLEIYFIDVEGGQATLIVTPQRQSLLIDTGWPDFDGRDTDRIVAAAKDAGLKQLDYVLITHYHRDHVGGVPQLAARMKIGAFVDHGANQEQSESVLPSYAAYEQAIVGSKHLVVKPGDSLPFRDIKLQVLTAAGEHITSSLPQAGQQNPYCASAPEPPEDPTENARSIGVLITFGRFRFIDLADLTQRKELELVCPVNRVGTVDLYLTTHHGLALSNARAIVDVLRPRVAIMNNGARKGASPAAWQIVHDSPGLQDLWQLHYAIESDADHNVAEERIANPQENCEGKYLKVSAQANGTFTVSNSRNNYSKTYRRK